MEREKISKVSKNVGHILDRFPKTRNSDKLLIVVYLRIYHDVRGIWGIADKDVPCIESITRARRSFQACGMYKAEENVSEQRSEEEVGYADFFRR